MSIDTPASAAAWLASWSNRPRAGILAETLRGLRIAREIDVTYRRSTVELDGAIALLEESGEG